MTINRFTDQTILITGAASGIGRITALHFAREGGRIVAADIDGVGCEAVAAEIEREGGQVLPLACDVTNEQEVRQLIAATIDSFGRLDVAFNNAGIEGELHRTADVTEGDFDRIMAVNVKGVWLCLKHEIRQMVAQGDGVIINTASVAGLVGAHSQPVYAASKHAVVGLTRSAALEYARKGLRINAVCPAVIETPMVSRAIEKRPRMVEQAVVVNPSRRMGEPEEVAAAVLWLASSEASFVNGVSMPIDGGLTAQ